MFLKGINYVDYVINVLSLFPSVTPSCFQIALTNMIVPRGQVQMTETRKACLFGNTRDLQISSRTGKKRTRMIMKIRWKQKIVLTYSMMEDGTTDYVTC